MDDLVADLRRQLESGAGPAREEPFGSAVDVAQFDAATRTFGYAATARLYRRLTGDRTYDAFGTHQRNWALGTNAWGTTFVIGEGTVFPHCPQHQVANLAGSLTGGRDVLVGAVVNGPNGPECSPSRWRPRRATRLIVMRHTRLYRRGVLEAKDFPAAQISDYLQQPDTVVWLDLCEPDQRDLEVVSEEFGLHPLAVEDAIQQHERPKLDRYQDHAFLTAYAVSLDPATGRLVTSELAAFATPRALITVRKDPRFDIDGVVARWDGSADLAVHGVGFLLWGLLDFVVDGHFATVQQLDEALEGLEELLFDNRPHSAEVQRRSFELRKSLVVLRRLVLPMREVVNSLLRRDLGLVDAAMGPYFQDVYDHVLRATEWTESLRDLVSTILETNLSIQGNRLNTITKKVTSWAAIIAVPTAVTGFYGMNVPYPGFGRPTGAVTSTVLIVILSGGLYLLFKRLDWL